jgi:hypothetical protein
MRLNLKLYCVENVFSYTINRNWIKAQRGGFEKKIVELLGNGTANEIRWFMQNYLRPIHGMLTDKQVQVTFQSVN